MPTPDRPVEVLRDGASIGIVLTPEDISPELRRYGVAWSDVEAARAGRRVEYYCSGNIVVRQHADA